MAIILEGPDGGGKTSFAATLIERFDSLQLMPRVVNQDTEAMTDLVKWVEEDNNRPRRESVLYDRHRLISEPIYGAALRRVPQPGFENIRWYSTQLYAFYRRQPLIIYCIPPMIHVIRHVGNDENNFRVREKIKTIYAAYVAKASSDCLNKELMAWWLDYTEPGRVEFMIQRVNDYLKGF